MDTQHTNYERYIKSILTYYNNIFLYLEVDSALYRDNQTRFFIQIQITCLITYFVDFNMMFMRLLGRDNLNFEHSTKNYIYIAKIIFMCIYNPPRWGRIFFPVGDYLLDSYCKSITIVNEEGDSVKVRSGNLCTNNIYGYKVDFKELWDIIDILIYDFSEKS